MLTKPNPEKSVAINEQNESFRQRNRKVLETVGIFSAAVIGLGALAIPYSDFVAHRLGTKIGQNAYNELTDQVKQSSLPQEFGKRAGNAAMCVVVEEFHLSSMELHKQHISCPAPSDNANRSSLSQHSASSKS